MAEWKLKKKREKKEKKGCIKNVWRRNERMIG